jgi:hypothetical protein
MEQQKRTCLDHVFEHEFPADEEAARILLIDQEVAASENGKEHLKWLGEKYQLGKPFTYSYDDASEETKQRYWQKHNEIAYLVWPKERKKKHLAIFK